MRQVFEYYGRFQDVRGNVLGLPAWARLVLAVVAAPAILAVLLSIAAVLCSLAALLLLTLPVYRLLRLMTQSGPIGRSTAEPAVIIDAPGRRHVDVKVVG